MGGGRHCLCVGRVTDRGMKSLGRWWQFSSGVRGFYPARKLTVLYRVLTYGQKLLKFGFCSSGKRKPRADVVTACLWLVEDFLLWSEVLAAGAPQLRLAVKHLSSTDNSRDLFGSPSVITF